ncbi:Elongation factor Tu GTP-binding domain-containing protein 1 [Galdieria sulphuraria]|nr:Elongation factor Tu GTP-binding domain-containing protein 1 [Galdieria sulphuraria]
MSFSDAHRQPPSLSSLQSQVERIRNFCFLAHVDHGKTALTDSLISCNGVISQRLVGKMRYLDSREDEQLRGITMKSSAISLCHPYRREDSKVEYYLINLVDSPGHVDFSGEVLCALSMVDGAIVVVDVVEGVCSQTHTVLQLAAETGIRPVLVLNKIDRLFLELKLSPLEAYQRIARVLEQVNVILGIQEAEKQLEDTDILEKSTNSEAIEYSFAPESGNVAFASAIDGWAFRLGDFAEIYAEKFGMKKQVLQKTLWGDYYYHSKQKRISKKPELGKQNARPMFVQFILENIWTVYQQVLLESDAMQISLEEMVERRKRIVEKLGLSIATRDLRHREQRTVLQAIMSSWLPAARCLLNMAVEMLPDPRTSQRERFHELFSSQWIPERNDMIYQAVSECDNSSDAPVMIYISKMFSVPSSSLNSNLQRNIEHRRELAHRAKNSEDPNIIDHHSTTEKRNMMEETSHLEPKKETLLAFARIFSGTLQSNSLLYVYGPRYDLKWVEQTSSVEKAEISKLFLLMGRDFMEIPKVSAATVSSLPPGKCIPFCPMKSPPAPVVRVAIEPKYPEELSQLKRGLRLLSQSDPSVESYIMETGELILAGAGELHLQRCLKDLKESFALTEIEVSPPLVYFKETVSGVAPAENVLSSLVEEESASVLIANDERHSRWYPKHSCKIVEETTSNGVVRLRVCAFPLAKPLAEALERSSDAIRSLFLTSSSVSDWFQESVRKNTQRVHKHDETSMKDAKRLVQQAIEEISVLEGEEVANGWRTVLSRAWSLGPRRMGPNILLGPPPPPPRNSVESCFSLDRRKLPDGATALQYYLLDFQDSSFDWMAEKEADPIEDTWETRVAIELHNSIVSGFQVATSSGPLCEEPMYGVCFSIEQITVDWELVHSIQVDPYGPLSGQVISSSKDVFRVAFLCAGPRLMEPIFHCDIQVYPDALGPMYGLLSKRRGKVVNADMKEGIAFFKVTAYLPVVESFEFVDILRKETSGAASPQMIFSHWEVIDKDPFWMPSTEEELEELSLEDTTASRNNLARKLVDQVRRRKGLKVEQKLVEKAEKQRNLSRKK